MSVYEYNRESTAERTARRQRAQERNAGEPGRDGLTDAERALLMAIRRAGYELTATEQYPRYVTRRSA